MSLALWVIFSLISSIFIGAFVTYLAVIIDNSRDDINMLRNHEMEDEPDNGYVTSPSAQNDDVRSASVRGSFRSSQGQTNMAFVCDTEIDRRTEHNSVENARAYNTWELDSKGVPYRVVGTHLI